MMMMITKGGGKHETGDTGIARERTAAIWKHWKGRIYNINHNNSNIKRMNNSYNINKLKAGKGIEWNKHQLNREGFGVGVHYEHDHLWRRKSNSKVKEGKISTKEIMELFLLCTTSSFNLIQKITTNKSIGHSFPTRLLCCPVLLQI